MIEGNLMRKDRLDKLVAMLKTDDFWTAVPLPTVAVSTPDFSSDLDRGLVSNKHNKQSPPPLPDQYLDNQVTFGSVFFCFTPELAARERSTVYYRPLLIVMPPHSNLHFTLLLFNVGPCGSSRTFTLFAG